MPAEPLTHNPLNGTTLGVWRDGAVVRKRLGLRTDAPMHWAASPDPRHWNHWAREALVYETGLPQRLGLGAPALRALVREGAEVELELEFVPGRQGGRLTVDDLEAVALALGNAQGAQPPIDEPWLSRGLLRAYSGSRPADLDVIAGDAAWRHPLVREHFPASLRDGLRRLHARRERLLDLMEALPRTICHLDVWPPNVVRRPDGEVVLLDWAFTGDGAIGEDIGNLIPDSVFDLHFPPSALPELDERLTRAYLAGLRAGGWRGDERIVRLGVCASAVKYDWLTAFSLEQAGAEQLAYGRAERVDAQERYAARAAGLALCARWADEAEELARQLGR
jgi:Phosphotransferase enzyme family